MVGYCIIGFSIYIFVGFVLLLWIGGYRHFPAPSRLVKDKKKGYWQYKDYILMPHWLWCAVLTVLWLPYICLFFYELRKYGPF